MPNPGPEQRQLDNQSSLGQTAAFHQAAQKLGLRSALQPAPTASALPVSYDLTAELQRRQAEQGEATARQMQAKLSQMATGWQQQQAEHQRALANTTGLFNALLEALPLATDYLNLNAAVQPSGEQVPTASAQIDGDRSVGVLNFLWHTLSFTLRGNRQPMAFPRSGRPPVLCGRIVALYGNAMDPYNGLYHLDYPALLSYELASLFVPADPTAPAIMTVSPLYRSQSPQKSGPASIQQQQEAYLYPQEAANAFLLKTIELASTLNPFHEGLG